MLTQDNNNNNNHKRKDKMPNDPQLWKEKRQKKQDDEAGPFPTIPEKDPEQRHPPPGQKAKEGRRKGEATGKLYGHLALDPNTANGSLCLSADNRTATYVRENQSYPQHPDRFAFWQQVLCTEGLTGGRWLFQVERSGWVSVALTYRTICRGRVDESLLGYNDRSWSLECYEGRDGNCYTFCHNKEKTEVGRGPSDSNGIAVCVDYAAGLLRFFRVSPSNERKCIFQYKDHFTEPLYPAFRLGWYDSSVSLVLLHKLGSKQHPLCWSSDSQALSR